MHSSDDYARRIESELARSAEREEWQTEMEHYAIINNAKAHIKAHGSANVQWMVERLQAAKVRALEAERLLARLAGAESTYRYVHDCEGDEAALVVGRAWDQMRRIGDEARTFLGSEESA